MSVMLCYNREVGKLTWKFPEYVKPKYDILQKHKTSICN